MFGLPWYARLLIDSTLIFGPFYLIACSRSSPGNPRGVTSYLTDARRAIRRKGTRCSQDYEQVALQQDAELGVEETKALLQQLGFAELK